MNLPRGRGRILTIDGNAFVAARCPLCHQEHRYAKGRDGGPEIDEIRKLGFSEEWLPCQLDLPGNFWRIVIGSARQSGKSTAPRRAASGKPS